jgi:ubiquinone/menaquinone biosynthesis C-methylase UbiE
MKKHEHSGCIKKTFENPKELLLLAGVEKGNSLLDIGTGTGYLSIAASEIVGVGGTIYALDIYQASIDALNQELSSKGIANVKPILADAVKVISIARNTIDICLMSNVLHGFVANEEIDMVLKNISEVLKEDGKLIIIDFKKAETLFGPPISVKLSVEEVENIVSAYGYVLNKEFTVGENHYGVVLNKVSLQNKFC